MPVGKIFVRDAHASTRGHIRVKATTVRVASRSSGTERSSLDCWNQSLLASSALMVKQVHAAALLLVALFLVAILMSEQKAFLAVMLAPLTEQQSRRDNDAKSVSHVPCPLPDCIELMSRQASFADGDFTARQGTNHEWVVQPDGSRQFELRSICRLHRHTADHARQCLAG